jgi:PIN domain nuclease of toxin-antitoxin system
VILDSHVFLWWGLAPEKLSHRAKTALAKRDGRFLWSVASTWELAIKVKTGKLVLGTPIAEFLDERLQHQGVELLLVEQRHAIRVASLPLHHRDPFDRMLVAQAQTEDVPILSSDPRLRAYDVEVVW